MFFAVLMVIGTNTSSPLAAIRFGRRRARTWSWNSRTRAEVISVSGVSPKNGTIRLLVYEVAFRT